MALICLLNLLQAMQLVGQENVQVSSYRRNATRCHRNQCNQMAVHNVSCIPCKESFPHLKSSVDQLSAFLLYLITMGFYCYVNICVATA